MLFLNPYTYAPCHGLCYREREARGIGFPWVVGQGRVGEPGAWRFVGSEAACRRVAAGRGMKDALVAVMVWSADPVPLCAEGDRYVNPDPATTPAGELVFA